MKVAMGVGLFPTKPPSRIRELTPLAEDSHADLVPGRLVDRFALAGTPDGCRARIEQIAGFGIDPIAIIPFPPPGGDRGRIMRHVADLVSA